MLSRRKLRCFILGASRFNTQFAELLNILAGYYLDFLCSLGRYRQNNVR